MTTEVDGRTVHSFTDAEWRQLTGVSWVSTDVGIVTSHCARGNHGVCMYHYGGHFCECTCNHPAVRR